MISKRIVLFFVAAFCLFASGHADDVTVSMNWENSTATLDCNSTSAVWTYNGTTLDGTDPIIKITKKSELGKYLCKTSEHDDINFEVVYLGKTIVEQGHRSLNFNNGETNRTIFCTNPDSTPPVTFTWYYRKEGEEGMGTALTTNKDYSIDNNEMNSTLTFLNLTYESRGVFTCQGSSVAGESSAEILIRVKDRLAALWPFLGIVLEVVILIFVIFIYERRSKKQAATENNVAPKDEAVPLKGDESDEIRLRTRNNNSK